MAHAVTAAETIRPSLAEVHTLIQSPAELGVSVYAPMDRAISAPRENALRLRQLLREAVHRVRELKQQNISARPLAQQLLQTLQDGPQEYTRDPEDGVALFIRPGLLKVVKAAVRFDERVWVGTRFVVTPMLEYLQGNGRFFVLATSQNDVRLFQGNKHFIRELDVGKLPKNLEQALQIDEHIRSTQFHTAGPGGRMAMGRGGGMFHGHSGDGEDKNDDLIQFLRRLDDALCKFWRDENAPLVFAGVEYLFAMFR